MDEDQEWRKSATTRPILNNKIKTDSLSKFLKSNPEDLSEKQRSQGDSNNQVKLPIHEVTMPLNLARIESVRRKKSTRAVLAENEKRKSEILSANWPDSAKQQSDPRTP